jgi:hypothetical protein
MKQSVAFRITVRGHEAAGGEQDDVPGHDLFDRQVQRVAISQHACTRPYPCLQIRRRNLGLVFARVAHPNAREHDREDDVGVYPFAGQRRRGGSKHQNEQQRVSKLVQQHTRAGQTYSWLDLIRPDVAQATGGLGAGETVRRCLEAAQQGVPVEGPIGVAFE